MQKFIATGRLGRDPEGKVVTYGEGDKTKELEKAEFSMAIDSGFGRNRKTTWINCECFGSLAKNVCTYMHKGDMMGIIGKLQINKFENKQGQKVTMTKIIVEEMQFLPKQATNQSLNPEDEYLPETTNVEPPKEPDDGFIDVPDGIEEDLPFR